MRPDAVSVLPRSPNAPSLFDYARSADTLDLLHSVTVSDPASLFTVGFSYRSGMENTLESYGWGGLAEARRGLRRRRLRHAPRARLAVHAAVAARSRRRRIRAGGGGIMGR